MRASVEVDGHEEPIGDFRISHSDSSVNSGYAAPPYFGTGFRLQ